MKITSMYVDNFKSINRLEIKDIDDAFILVGKNNTGKSSVIDAIRAAAGDYTVDISKFANPDKNVVIGLTLDISDDEDMEHFYNMGAVSKARDKAQWLREFSERLPGYRDGQLKFEYMVRPDGTVIYSDVTYNDIVYSADSYNIYEGKYNPYIEEVLPKIYYVDHNRSLDKLQKDFLSLRSSSVNELINDDRCIADTARNCTQCFKCMQAINKKNPEELTMIELIRLMQHKLFSLNLGKFADAVNSHLRENGEMSQSIRYEIGFDADSLFEVKTIVNNIDRNTKGDLETMSTGSRSIYLLSLLQAYMDEKNKVPSIIIIEDPEIYLHPQLQKAASEILFKLSKKNQIIFSTYSPNMIFNFSSRQIKQVVLDENYYTTVIENMDIDKILDDLGYTANDLMNVSFVFIVEGKQDGYRLPMLLEKYYSEMRDEDGKLQRISIIQTNSCTNIKTYANLKYINQLYLKDQFLMIRDSDGKNPNHLKRQLCSYYEQRAKEDAGNIPRVKPRNVLILKYYSFENYFLDPKIMTKIGVINNEDEFYTIFIKKYNDYLKRIPSMKRLIRTKNLRINNKNDVKANMELIKTYVRGHNLFDIYYGRYKGDKEREILRRYIDVAPRETFADILDAIDSFVYFENRRID